MDFYENNDYLILRPSNYQNIAIPIHTNLTNNTTFIPARSEVIRKINVETSEKEILIINQELEPGVIIANTIIESKRAFVRILNTNIHDVNLKIPKIKFEKLSDYDIVELPPLSNRKEEILVKISKNTPSEHNNVTQNLCSEFCDIFGLEKEPISANNFYKQKLKLVDSEPVYIKNYRIPHSHKAEVERQVKKLVEDDIVEPSTSAYNSPLLLVPKKSLPNSSEKRWRLVVDFRRINTKLVADKFPLPRIDDILDELGRAKYFSCLDLMSGFHLFFDSKWVISL